MSRNDADLFAFCDQDNSWHPEKVARQVAIFDDPDTSLCHSDARIVARDGELIAPSMFAREARASDAGLADLLVMNSVTGMTAIFRRDVALAAQNFPLAGCRYVLHDHWVALVASLFGRTRFIADPLVDYTQHPDNVRGATSWSRGGRRNVPLSQTRAYLRKSYREFLWRRRILEALRREFAHVTPAQIQLSEGNPRRILRLQIAILVRACGQPRAPPPRPAAAIRSALAARSRKNSVLPQTVRQPQEPAGC